MPECRRHRRTKLSGEITLAPALLRDTFGVLEYVSTYWMAGTEHVRETIPFPRMLYRLKP